jgi:hypothetical protein
VTLNDACPPKSSKLGLNYLGLQPRVLLACHRDARDALTQDDGQDFVSPGQWGRISALLSFADLVGLERREDMCEAVFDQPSGWSDLVAEADQLRYAVRQERQRRVSAQQRSIELDAQLCAVYASTSWAVTAPLRMFGNHWRPRALGSRSLRPGV